MSFDPVPSSSDFRIECETDQLELVKKSFEEREKDRFSNIIKDLYIRLAEPLKHLVVTLTNPSIKIYHKSLLANIETNTNLVISYNITNNQDIVELSDKINKEILIFNIKTLKVDEPSKQQIIQNANEILLEINEKLN